MAYDLLSEVKTELERNDNKISPNFIGELVLKSTQKHFQLTSTMRVCVLTLPSGHEVLGKAQVLDPANDIESIGNAVARDNAINEIWAQVGSIAKALI